jgi:hypothetical protein
MISSLASLADRNFIAGFLLPVILALVCFLFVFQDVSPLGALWTKLTDAQGLEAITLVLLAMWAAALLLSLLNSLLYRTLQGYIGPLAGSSSPRQKQKQRDWRERSLALNVQFTAAEPTAHGSKERLDYLASNRQFIRDYPPYKQVLPTRFGNVIRASEMYSLQTYGVDSIAAWVRLVGIIPADYRASIDNARADMDFFVNIMVLSLLVGTMSLLAVLAVLVSCAFVNCYDFFGFPFWRRLISAVVLGLTACFAYEAAIDRARAWGEIVRGGFDLYLPDLAKQLGYDMPPTLAERREFWGALNGLFLDWTAVHPERWPPAKNDSPNPK